LNNNAAFSALPYLNDLAALEWLYHKAYYAADDTPVMNHQFAGVDASLKLERSSSLFLMTSLFPIYAIWQNHQDDNCISEVAALSEEDFILLFRQQGHPQVQQLDREEWRILQSIEGQVELNHIVQNSLVEGVDIEKKLPEMIQQGWLRLC
jgi:hypothetical protein